MTFEFSTIIKAFRLGWTMGNARMTELEAFERFEKIFNNPTHVDGLSGEEEMLAKQSTGETGADIL